MCVRTAYVCMCKRAQTHVKGLGEEPTATEQTLQMIRCAGSRTTLCVHKVPPILQPNVRAARPKAVGWTPRSLLQTGGGSAELFSAGWHGRRVIDMDLKAMPVAPSAVVGSSCAPRTVPKGHIASTYTSGHISKFKHDRLPYTGHAASLPAPRAKQLKVAAWQHGGMRLAQGLFCSGRTYRVRTYCFCANLEPSRVKKHGP